MESDIHVPSLFEIRKRLQSDGFPSSQQIWSTFLNDLKHSLSLSSRDAKDEWMDLSFEVIGAYKRRQGWETPFEVLDALLEHASMAEATITLNGLASWHGKTKSIGVLLAQSGLNLLRKRTGEREDQNGRNLLEFLPFCQHLFHSKEEEEEEELDSCRDEIDSTMKEEDEESSKIGKEEEDEKEGFIQDPLGDAGVNIINMDGRMMGMDVDGKENVDEDELVDHVLFEKCVDILELVVEMCPSLLQKDTNASILLLKNVTDMASKVFLTNSHQVLWEKDMLTRLIRLWRRSHWGLEYALDYHHHTVLLDELFDFRKRTQYLREISKKVESSRPEIDLTDEYEDDEVTRFQKKHPLFRSNFNPTGVAYVLVASLLSHSPQDCFPSPITKCFIMSRLFRHLAAMMSQCEQIENARHQHQTMEMLIDVLENMLSSLPPHSIALENQSLKRKVGSEKDEKEKEKDSSFGFQSITKYVVDIIARHPIKMIRDRALKVFKGLLSLPLSQEDRYRVIRMCIVQAPYPTIRSLALQSWADEFCVAWRQESMNMMSSTPGFILQKRMKLLWRVLEETMSMPQENIDLILTCVSVLQRFFFVLRSKKVGWEKMFAKSEMAKIKADVLGQLQANIQAALCLNDSPELGIGIFQLNALQDLVTSALQ